MSTILSINNAIQNLDRINRDLFRESDDRLNDLEVELTMSKQPTDSFDRVNEQLASRNNQYDLSFIFNDALSATINELFTSLKDTLRMLKEPLTTDDTVRKMVVAKIRLVFAKNRPVILSEKTIPMTFVSENLLQSFYIPLKMSLEIRASQSSNREESDLFLHERFSFQNHSSNTTSVVLLSEKISTITTLMRQLSQTLAYEPSHRNKKTRLDLGEPSQSAEPTKTTRLNLDEEPRRKTRQSARVDYLSLHTGNAPAAVISI